MLQYWLNKVLRYSLLEFISSLSSHWSSLQACVVLPPSRGLGWMHLPFFLNSPFIFIRSQQRFENFFFFPFLVPVRRTPILPCLIYTYPRYLGEGPTSLSRSPLVHFG